MMVVDVKAVLEGMATTVTYSMNSITGGNFALNLLMGQSLQLLWGMINGFQLMARLPLMEINTPANTQFLYGFIVEVSSFQVVPVNNLEDSFMNFDELEQQSRNKYFDLLGYNSMNVIVNLGLLFQTSMLMVIMVLVAGVG